MHNKVVVQEPHRRQQIIHLCIATAGSWCQCRGHTACRAQQHGGYQQQGNSRHACCAPLSRSWDLQCVGSGNRWGRRVCRLCYCRVLLPLGKVEVWKESRGGFNCAWDLR